MKKTLLYALLLAVLAVAAPFLCLLLPRGTTAPDRGETPAIEGDLPQPTPALPEAGSRTGSAQALADVTVYDAAVGKEIAVPAVDFLVGAAACEMPTDWPDAALQAQMVASHSYALSLGSNAMQVNSAQCLGWADTDLLQSRWGADFEEKDARLRTLAEQVVGRLLLYEGAPAASCYHAISAGHTEASQNVWVEALPYLQGVSSPWDTAAPDYEVEINYTEAQVASFLEGLELVPDDDPAHWFGPAQTNENGYVGSMTVCGKIVRGTKLRSALALRSACFTVDYEDGGFTLVTHGYGHGVGLSQYGAYAMAEGGAGWEDILRYYFPGCEVE